MKIKFDFVTNSSSTSFIISGKSEEVDKETIKNTLNGIINEHRQNTEWDKDSEQPPLIRTEMIQLSDSGTFDITDFIPIQNDEGDTQWLKDIFFSNDSEASKRLESAGIRITNVGFKNFNK